MKAEQQLLNLHRPQNRQPQTKWPTTDWKGRAADDGGFNKQFEEAAFTCE